LPASYPGLWNRPSPTQCRKGHCVLAQRTSEIAGILWHQGENDSINKNDAVTYQKRFIQMITQLRKDLGNDELPVIVGELGRFASTYQDGKLKYVTAVNESLRTMPSVIKNCGFVSSEGLMHRGDNIHFNSASYRVLGKRYFDEYLILADKVVKECFKNEE